MKIKNLVVLLISTIMVSSISYSQTREYINEEWEKSVGNIGVFKRTVSAIDNNKNLIIVSNILNTSNNSDVLITKLAPNGTTLWQKTFNGSGNGNDYGVQLKINSNNDIFVVATIDGGISNSDFGILKYSSNGNLIWNKTWNGEANGVDIPADIIIDQNNNVYIVGGSTTANGYSDYAIIKLNNQGILQWESSYDYANLYDAAVSAVLNSNQLIVSGASASSLVNWDYATLVINSNNGQIINEKRSTVTGVGLDNVVAVTSDINNNTYITGYVDENGNKNIQTLKINENFELEWIKNFDGGFEDVAKAIGVDDFGNVYILGTKKNTNGNKNYVTIKYDLAGNEIWNKEYGSKNDNINAEAEHLVISNNGDIIITGTIKDVNSKKEFATLKYTPNGEINFIQKYDAGNQDNEAKYIAVIDNNIYVTGLTNDGTNIQNTTVKYENVERKIEPVLVNGEESYVKSEIIVHFPKSSLNLSAIDRKGFIAGKLNQFIKSEVISQLNDSTDFDWNNLKTYKIHKGATSGDTVSYTRLGDTISLSNFWGSLIIKIPEKQRELSIIEQIKNINGVDYAQLNYVYETRSVPNDPYYYNYQLGYRPNNLYPNSDINVSGAWDYLENKGYKIGSNDVKVGVFDWLIDYTHPEFNGDNGVDGSKIVYGKDYFTGNSIVDADPVNNALSHGTIVAGLIGANRNDELGIAGIVGGNISSAPQNNGVSLYSIGIFSLNNSTTTDIITEALNESSVETNTGYGQGLNIANHSYGSNGGVSSFDFELNRTLKESWRNGTINIVARGNKGNDGNPVEYPTCYEDKLIINVVASGTDGERKKSGNGGTDFWQSSYGISTGQTACFVDVMAPGVIELVSSTVPESNLYLSDVETSSAFSQNCLVPLFNDNNLAAYTCMDGTSVAAPHVTGVASLMYSAHDPANNSVYKNKLTTEDVEHILEKTTFKSSHVYEDEDGYGRVNAEEAVKQITLPYSVYHLSLTLDNANTNNIVETSTTSNSIYTYQYIAGPTGNNVQSLGGPYFKKNKYKAQWTINFTPDYAQIVDWWKVEARISGAQTPYLNINATSHYYVSEPNFVVENLNIDTINNKVTGTITAYYYEFLKQNGTNIIHDFLPKNPNLDIRYTLALHLKGDDDLNVEDIDKEGLLIYPNPANTEITIKNIPENIENYTITIFDASGKVITTKKELGQNSKVGINSLSNGLYFLKLEGGNDFKGFSKFIKQ